MQIKVETKPWKIELPSRNIEIELTTVQSNYHVEMNPSDVGNQDRHIVQEVIKVSSSSALARVPKRCIFCSSSRTELTMHASPLHSLAVAFWTLHKSPHAPITGQSMHRFTPYALTP
jgi:hypothetical protein